MHRYWFPQRKVDADVVRIEMEGERVIITPARELGGVFQKYAFKDRPIEEVMELEKKAMEDALGLFARKKKALLLFSHDLTLEQREELKRDWDVEMIEPLPPELQRLWSSVPPDLAFLSQYLEPVLEWMGKVGAPGDVAVVQGDYGASYLTVSKAFKLGLIPVYATTEREMRETHLPDGSVKQERIFRHVRFRVYGR